MEQPNKRRKSRSGKARPPSREERVQELAASFERMEAGELTEALRLALEYKAAGEVLFDLNPRMEGESKVVGFECVVADNDRLTRVCEDLGISRRAALHSAIRAFCDRFDASGADWY